MLLYDKMTALSVDSQDQLDGMAHSLGDITKAKKDFGYEPGDKLEENLKETVKWFRELYSSE